MNAAEAAAELERLRAEHGRLTPEIIVEAAEAEDSPLHDAFTWDDAEAAHQHRLLQARILLRAVVRIPSGEASRPISVYVHVPGRGGGDYQPMEAVVRDQDAMDRALAELTAKLHGAQAAVDELLDLARQGQDPDRISAAQLASQGMQAVREALSILRQRAAPAGA